MRRAVELAVKRIIRSRYGLAALIAIGILGILASGRLVVGSRNDGPPPLSAGVDQPVTTVDPTAGDDGLVSAVPPPSPVTSPGAAKPLAVASAFATAWLRHRDVTAEQWQAGLKPHCTQDLIEQLAGADPAGVPADRITGEAALVPHGSTFVEVAIPLDSGRLLLRLVAPQGRWLVDGVDWERM